MRTHPKRRRGFSTLEAALSLGVLASVIALTGQMVAWGIRERQRNLAHQEAVEAVANLLESARSTSWAELNDDWAAAQHLPSGSRLSTARLSVRVESKALGLANLKRVTVEIAGKGLPTVQESAWFSARERSAGEEKP